MKLNAKLVGIVAAVAALSGQVALAEDAPRVLALGPDGGVPMADLDPCDTITSAIAASLPPASHGPAGLDDLNVL